MNENIRIQNNKVGNMLAKGIRVLTVPPEQYADYTGGIAG